MFFNKWSKELYEADIFFKDSPINMDLFYKIKIRHIKNRQKNQYLEKKIV